jgi:Ca2+-binding EF-hand superfamily protein
VRCQFLKRVNDPERITVSEFVAIPSVANNPLQERLLICFGLHAAGSKHITFRDFLETLSTFNNPTAPVDLKMRAAFQLQDFDDDGEISKQDLIRYASLAL